MRDSGLMASDWNFLEFAFHEFEWDHEKERKNRTKHGVGFLEATQIFNQEILARQDFDESEDRYFAIGITATRTLAIVFTERLFTSDIFWVGYS